MKYSVIPTSKFKKDLKRAKKRNLNIEKLEKVITILSEGKTLPEQYYDHDLTGNFTGCRECHISPDWLLIYQINDNDLILVLTRTGTHSDLFD